MCPFSNPITRVALCSCYAPVPCAASCTTLPVDMEEWSVQEKNLVDELVPLYCPKSTHYNEVASLYLTDSDTAIKQVPRHRYTA
jgi:hypothetical protein